MSNVQITTNVSGGATLSTNVGAGGQISSTLNSASPVQTNVQQGQPVGSDITPSSQVFGSVVSGAQGPQGIPGAQGIPGLDGQDGATGATGLPGADGADGADGAPGQGVPTGGTIGQHLAKIDSTDFNTEWVDPIDISGKQDTLISGTNIKTINGGSVLGSGDITISGGGSSLIIDTERNILTSAPTDPSVALASDTKEYYAYDGTNWNEASLALSEAGLDAGAYQSDAQGYYFDGITSKYLYNMVLRGTDREEEGSIGIDTTTNPTTLRIYSNGEWRIIITNFSINTDNELVHFPAQREIDVRSGNSSQLSLSGYPVIQEYQTSAGAYQPPVILSGGTL